MSSEFARIGLIEAILKRPSGNIALGIGDDCAVLHPSAHPRVWTVDAAVEGVHFSRAFQALDELSYRAFMAAASDLAAMGARGVAALSSLTLPIELTDGELIELAKGLARAADLCACPVVGGNLARANVLTLTTSVLGECPSRVITRSGAKPGDDIFVTGPVGAAALGLRALQRGEHEQERWAEVVRRFRAPRARLDVALELAAIASAAIDISDGLLQDLGHLCRASGVGARVESDSLPRVSGFEELARELGEDAHALMLLGGEDYEVLFTSAESVPSALAARIGRIGEPPEVVAVDASGRELKYEGGFDHFA